MQDQDKNLDVTIQSTRGTKPFSFAKQTKVSEAIDQAVSAFGLAAGDNFELMLASDTENGLQPERPLASYGIKDGDTLILTATGSGV